MHWLFKTLVSIFIELRDDSNNDIARGNYRRKRIPKKCDNCTLTPTKIFRYNNAYLCEKCYNMTVAKFSQGKGKV